MTKAVSQTVVPSTSKGVVTQVPQLFKDGIGLGASRKFEGVGLGGSDEGGLGGQALVVLLRPCVGYHKGGFCYSEMFSGRWKVSKLKVPVSEIGGCNQPLSLLIILGGGSSKKGQMNVGTGRLKRKPTGYK